MIGLLIGSLLLTPVSAGVTDNLNLALKNALSILEEKVKNQNSSIKDLKNEVDLQGESIENLESKAASNPITKWPPEVAYKSPGDTFTIGKYTYFIFSKSDSKMRVLCLGEYEAPVINLVSDAASVLNPAFITLKNNGYNVARPSTNVNSDSEIV